MDRIYFGIRMPLAGEMAIKHRGSIQLTRIQAKADVAEQFPYQKKAAGLGTLRLLLVIFRCARGLSPKGPRDQSHVNRPCVHNKHERERPV
jgi:hypothetical protein